MFASQTRRRCRALRSLLATTISKSWQVARAHGAWDTPMAHSQAGQEMAAEEARRPNPLTGSWPWMLGPMIARWALQVAAEEARGLIAVLDPQASACAPDVLCRSVLESASLAWWLLDPDVDAAGRLARSLAYRLNTADHTKRAIQALELGQEETPGEYGELPDDVRREIRDSGLSITSRKLNGRPTLFCGDEPLPSYTERAASLAGVIWPQRKLPYALLSATTHAELLGLQRNLASSPRRPSELHVAPGPDTALWLWQDTYLTIGALAFTASRAAGFLGLDHQVTDLHMWITELDRRLPALRPAGG